MGLDVRSGRSRENTLKPTLMGAPSSGGEPVVSTELWSGVTCTVYLSMYTFDETREGRARFLRYYRLCVVCVSTGRDFFVCVCVLTATAPAGRDTRPDRAGHVSSHV